MKKYKQILACALGSAFVFLFAACGDKPDNPQNGTETIRPTYTTTVYDEYYNTDDDYLRENGYPEEFIKNTGVETKKMLREANATFDMTADVPEPSDSVDEKYWRGFSFSATVSDASTEEDRHLQKYLTISWSWNGTQEPHDLPGDYLDIQGPSDGFIPYKTLIEISGTGDLAEAYTPEGEGHAEVPQTAEGTFYTLNGTESELRQNFSGTHLNVMLPDPENFALQVYYGPPGSSGAMSHGIYRLNALTLRGTCTVVVSRHVPNMNVFSTFMTNYVFTAEGQRAESSLLALSVI